MEEDIKSILEQFVDYLQPELIPYETALYLYLLYNSFVKMDTCEIRIGKRTIASEFGRGSRGESTSYAHVSKILKMLEEKECIKVEDANIKGTLYIVNLPKDIPLVIEKIASTSVQDTEENYFNDPEKRHEIFERDMHICQYCGEKVNSENATLDHFIPQIKGGKHTKENLKTCCFICNSIKSGKNYEEAAPLLLKSIRERKTRSHK